MENLIRKLFILRFSFFVNKAAFTLIELLIVMSIMSILAAIMFGSQYSIREQTQLFQDHYKILDYINQAKSFTLGAFRRFDLDNPDVISVCGYGVSFNYTPGEIILYKDRKEVIPNRESGVAGTDCNSDQHNHGYNPEAPSNDEKISSFYLNKTEKFYNINVNSDDLNVKSMVFNAPALNVYLIEDNNKPDNISITLHAIKSGQNLGININQLGQVSSE